MNLIPKDSCILILIQGISAVPIKLFSVDLQTEDFTLLLMMVSADYILRILNSFRATLFVESQADLEFTGLMAATFAPLKENG